MEENLEVLKNKTILNRPSGIKIDFMEGPSSQEAKNRLAFIKDKLENGYFDNIAGGSHDLAVQSQFVSEAIYNQVKVLVDSVTSEYGRAIVALSVFQLVIKSLTPGQSIRLHKSSSSRGSFSWVEGIPMRSIDKSFITPVLRKYNLISMNADGMFMTRSLAENYPYSKMYKAELKGAKDEWLDLVDIIEENPEHSEKILKIMVTLLRNRSEKFTKESNELLVLTDSKLNHFTSLNLCSDFIANFIDKSGYSARVFEIALHSLFQVLDEDLAFDGHLQPLGQMRTPNKKKGNIGDIEVSEDKAGTSVLESWDAKFGKQYLREEIEEVAEKVMGHPNIRVLGFVTDKAPDRRKEIIDRIKEIQDYATVKIEILSMKEWVLKQKQRYTKDEATLAQRWFLVFVECICQKRRETAPIDEPCDQWVKELTVLLKALLKRKF